MIFREGDEVKIIKKHTYCGKTLEIDDVYIIEETAFNGIGLKDGNGCIFEGDGSDFEDNASLLSLFRKKIKYFELIN